MFHLAHSYARHQMIMFVELQRPSPPPPTRDSPWSSTSARVGTGYFDVTSTIERIIDGGVEGPPNQKTTNSSTGK